MSTTIAPKVISKEAPPRMPLAEPCVVVIFGASGDLSKRKLVPALYDLYRAGSLDGGFAVLGVGQPAMSDEDFRHFVRAGAESSEEIDGFDSETWAGFAPRLHYMAGDLNSPVTYQEIETRLAALLPAAGGRSNYLFYFSTPPTLAPAIVRHLGERGLNREERGWSRVVVEKPFGHDLASARALNEEIARIFQEHQVYRIDHYLGKETVQNVLVFRFGNSLFEPVWNRNYIDYVEITAAETLGVEHRAGYYERAGALRDMVANHLLQLLALTAMEPPVAFDANSVREEKVQVFRSIRPMSPEEVAERTVHGQYGEGTIDGQTVPAYHAEPNVNPASTTETYAAVEFRIDNWRWADVPFYLRTGKRLSRKVTEIAIHLKRTPQALFACVPREECEANVIVLRIQPDEGVAVTFGAKQPGTEMVMGMVKMDFRYSSGFGVRPAAAYETLLLDAMQGDATLYTRRDETEAEWRLITPILEAWSQQPPPRFPNYAAGSDGPAAADELLARHGHHWRPIKR
ncbi:MAG: glucose-6-phosphate dehydrogenase [Pyrinomonadaceae bacterium]